MLINGRLASSVTYDSFGRLIMWVFHAALPFCTILGAWVHWSPGIQVQFFDSGYLGFSLVDLRSLLFMTLRVPSGTF
ncbi:hypothetical protein RO3G_03702 [Rhizopus delemar RA 99-880]|uniref:Uncharacterized protein n=1 Tax=Rhizopus delemar (strain RA 99-880 / ATCC MYA-4621 / FGSC 9543 / NRRL 43880) TaxID=246409 RepID=I1BS17_RHIO9|nr:hypothetical protein RO3G_03702 [Rhizopus delemar RA 99-880]|eukprot:EIE78997.1 hypothetical protein RO3G_03702 [Rhizopus delemar RA 99-880]